LEPAGVELLPLTVAITTRAVALSDVHKDPFDRMILATTQEYDATLASADGAFARYPEMHGRLI